MRRISLGYNAVPKSAKNLVLEVLASGQFSPGPKVREFEEKFASLHNAKHAVFVNSGTDALRLSLLALKEKHKWQDGDEVIVPALTFVATVNVILQANLKPRFVDVDPETYCMSYARMSDVLIKGNTVGSRIVAVMPVHLFGQAVEPVVIRDAKANGLKVLEDSCETILNELQGDVSCHSTYMAHHLTTGVGGMALTNDTHVMYGIRSFANHGRNVMYLPGRPASLHSQRDIMMSRFRFERVGYSCRGTEFEAALGLSQLDGLAENVLRRQLVASLLLKALECFDALTFPKGGQSTCMMFPIVLKEDSKIDKYDLCLHLEKNGIETRDMMPITNQLCYRNIVDEDDFPVARNVNKNGFYIPCHPGMGPEDIKHIKNTFGSYLIKKAISVIHE